MQESHAACHEYCALTMGILCYNVVLPHNAYSHQMIVIPKGMIRAFAACV
jgi:hypothetical protein